MAIHVLCLSYVLYVPYLQVRGAPLIAIVAALGLSVEVSSQDEGTFSSADDASKFLQSKMEYLRTSRPTGILNK